MSYAERGLRTGAPGNGFGGKVTKFNLEVAENRWARELVFLIFYIVPVHEIAGAIDLIIIDSIELHTGANPITDRPRIARAPGR